MAQFPCPLCGGKMHIEVIHEGYEVPCPHCDGRFRVPRGAASSAAAAAASDERAAPEVPPEVPPLETPAEDAGTGSVPPALAVDAPPAVAAPTRAETAPTQRFAAPPRALPGQPGSGGQPDSRATLALVFGILGLVACNFFAPFAWYIGHQCREDARRRGQPPEGIATAGWIMGLIGTILFVLMLLVAVVAVVVSMAGRM